MERLLRPCIADTSPWLAAILLVAALGNTACGRIGFELYDLDDDAGSAHADPGPDDGDLPTPDPGDSEPDASIFVFPDTRVLDADETEPDGAAEASVDASTTDLDAHIELPPDAGLGDASTPAAAASTVACGELHSCGVFASQLYCWGGNGTSALGSSASASISSPQAVDTAIADWAQVEAGWSFTCARTRAGDVWCWGQNNAGQLGVGDTATRALPVQVPLPAAARSISAYFQAACALLTDDSLWCWGDNYEGQMGQSDTFPGSNEPDPLRVPGSWSAVSVGQGHHCALRAPGELWCMGRNSEDELGLGPTAPIQLRAPTRVGSASDWTQVSAGQQYTCGVRGTGSLWCWGDNTAGMLGLGDMTARDLPTQVGSEQDWRAIRGHSFHTCGIRAPGTLWCWGRNVEGQLGLADNTRRVVPTQVGTATDWIDVAIGHFHTCARRADGSLWCTGQNQEGRLGTGDETQRNVFTQVSAP